MDDYIKLMSDDFNDAKLFFENNGGKMQSIEERIDVLLAKNIEVLKYLVEDIVFFYDTLQLYRFTCYQLVGSSNSFFNITTFIRANLESTFVILEKLKDLLKKISNDDNIVDKINSINTDLLSKKEFRNSLEHALDPYYGGDYFKIKKEFPLEKQLYFLECVVEIIENLSCKNVILTNVVLKLEYEPLSREKIKEVATSMNDIQKNIFLHTCEMSYRVENVLKEMEELSTALYLQGFDRDRIAYELKKRGTGREEKSIIDLCFKLLESNKSLIYIFDSDCIKVALKGTIESYFSRIAIIKCYQMCDKLGTYISLGSNEKTYFKNVCKNLEEKENQLNDVELKMLHLYQSAHYAALSQIRNFIEHKKGLVDYDNNSEIICSVIINVYKELNLIVQCIVTQYFKINGIEISERAYREVDEKGMIHRI